MRSQLACGKLWVTCVAGAPSHVAVVAGTGFPSALRRQVNWQRCAVRVGRCKLRQWKGRRVMSVPFAALSANETAEAGLKGDVNGEGAVRGREGLVSSVGTPAYSLAAIQDWYMADKQLVVISLSAFVRDLLAAAIPSRLAIKKAAEALEKLADTAREELPGTMAAIRLSGMEISDLTMELNDLGQEISRGVKNSTRALNAAESGMRQVGGLASNETGGRFSASNAISLSSGSVADPSAFRIRSGHVRPQMMMTMVATKCALTATPSASEEDTLPQGATELDAAYMRMCVDLAKEATGKTSPNPIVGCVIVKDGRIVGRGYHPKAGEPHAEVFALREAGPLAQGATAYVSLEPCNHHGRTPPCSHALVKAKLKRVVVGVVDPNHHVGGKGIKTLQNARIEVVVGVEEALCRRTNEVFMHRMLTGQPFVT